MMDCTKAMFPCMKIICIYLFKFLGTVKDVNDTETETRTNPTEPCVLNFC